ncbi:MAG: transcriptional repressor [Bacteroidetes bacterium]|nr:transcriptional repressor [Bacteroidota bacterium]
MSITRLSKAGIKVTPQRVAVFEALMSLGHASADEIINKVQEHAPYISQATIYNTLDKFVHTGLISRIATDGNKMFFDITPDPHVHLCARDNSFITDANIPELEQLIANFMLGINIPGFNLDRVQVNLVGQFT